MKPKDRIDRINKFLNNYNILSKYDWDVRIIDDIPVITFQSISAKHRRSLIRILKKNGLDHIVVKQIKLEKKRIQT